VNKDEGEFGGRGTGCERFGDKNKVAKVDAIPANSARMKRRGRKSDGIGKREKTIRRREKANKRITRA